MDKIIRWFKTGQRATLTAFLILGFFGGWAITVSSNHGAQKLYQGQLAACKRGNILRNEVNKGTATLVVQASVINDFLESARVARLETSKKESGPTKIVDQRAAVRYGALAKRLHGTVHFKKLDLVNCTKVLLKP